MILTTPKFKKQSGVEQKKDNNIKFWLNAQMLKKIIPTNFLLLTGIRNRGDNNT